MKVGIDIGENWSNSARVRGRGNLGVIVYFDPIKLKLRTQIGLGTKQENIKFGVDWSNGSLVTVIGKKTF